MRHRQAYQHNLFGTTMFRNAITILLFSLGSKELIFQLFHIDVFSLEFNQDHFCGVFLGTHEVNSDSHESRPEKRGQKENGNEHNR